MGLGLAKGYGVSGFPIAIDRSLKLALLITLKCIQSQNKLITPKETNHEYLEGLMLKRLYFGHLM